MNSTTIQETMRLWQDAPDKAKVKPTVKARSDGSQVVFESGPFSWRADFPGPLGGTNEAPSPTALLLSALAGCAVVFIRDTIAPQLGVEVTEVRAVAQRDADLRGLLGMPGTIPDLQNIQISIQIQSSDTQENIQRLYRVWQERCSIYLALVKSLEVKTSLGII
ncbi:OsmC family protein [Thermoflexus sp.]|uniref:OsmC family protein n=1 Tax=Thermoflexus sp. TaxID=1969742 RepID=UPI0035E3FED4